MAERRRRPRASVAGLFAGLFAALLGFALPETARERLFDGMLALTAGWREPLATPPLALVAIDTASLDSVGPWPWPRETLARLIGTIAAAGPAAIAVDVLLAEPDMRSPAALARGLAARTGRSEFEALAGTLPDGDRQVAEAISAAPVALGFVLDPRGTGLPRDVPMLMRDGAAPAALWTQAGATAPVSPLADAAEGAGALSLPGDADGVVRRVPMLVSVAGTVRPGLAAEALRLWQGASGYLVSTTPARLGIGEIERPLPSGGLLRLVPEDAPAPVARVSAGTVLAGSADLDRLGRAIVFIGGTAAELGGLRASAGNPLTPSVNLHIAAARQFAAGRVPQPIGNGGAVSALAALLLTVIALLSARRLRPLGGALLTGGACLGVLAAALAAAGFDRLVDPLPALLAGGTAFLTCALWTFSETKLREARLRRRFEQHLAPGVVERIVADPDSVKLSGERREITALFTDIEGFTAMTSRLEPEALVAILDGYFAGVTGIVAAHGGMVDKFVGDAVHALFNAPLDLADHTGKALACAREIVDWTESYRRAPAPAAAGLGRTRIGIETGPAVVGDVGLGGKLDYTAHGDAVNTAARLEALNKRFGTSICVGPVAAARCTAAELRHLGQIEVAGRGNLDIYTPA